MAGQAELTLCEVVEIRKNVLLILIILKTFVGSLLHHCMNLKRLFVLMPVNCNLIPQELKATWLNETESFWA